MSRKRIIFILRMVVILIAVYAVTGLLILPWIVKSLFASKLSASLKREASVEEVHINPFTFSVVLRDITIQERNSYLPFLAIREVSLNFELLPLFKGMILLDEVRLLRPYLNLTRNKGGGDDYNFSDLLSSKKEKGEGVKFQIRNLSLSDGSLGFMDLPRGKRHKFSHLYLTLPFVSNQKDSIDLVAPFFWGGVNGGKILCYGKVTPFSKDLSATFRLGLREIDLKEYGTYLPSGFQWKLVSGLGAAESWISFRRPPGQEPEFRVKGSLRLKDFGMEETENRFRIEDLEISGIDWDQKREKLLISDLVLTSPTIAYKANKGSSGSSKENLKKEESQGSKSSDRFSLEIDRSALKDLKTSIAGFPEGRAELSLPVFILNKLSLIPSEKSLLIGEILSKNLHIDILKEDPPLPGETQAGGKKGDGWKVKIGNLALDQGGVTYRDDSRKVFLETREMKIEAKNFATLSQEKAILKSSFMINKTGLVSFDGTFSHEPASLNLDLQVKDAELAPFAPYLLEMSNVALTGGSLRGQGHLTAGKGEGSLHLGFKGEANIRDLASVDQTTGRKLLSCRDFEVKIDQFQLVPFALNVSQATLDGLAMRMIINKEGSINLLSLLKEPKEQEQGKNLSKRDINVEEIVFRDGTIDFRDEHIEPNYSATLEKTEGTIRGISSTKNEPAVVRLKSMLNQYTPMEIHGTMNPFSESRNADLLVDAKGIDLPPLNPFVTKYIGYSIEKGKLTLNVKYRIEKDHLSGSNGILLDQLSLGEAPEGKSTGLPVKLWIALLMNRKGIIDLNIPVNGNLKDPNFSLFGVIMGGIKGLILKAAESPVTFLSSLLGHGGKKLESIDFGFGDKTIKAGETEKLKVIIKDMEERPGLKLEIQGFAGKEQDREGLKQVLFDNALKLQKYRETRKRGISTFDPSKITIGPGEYSEYLKKAYDFASIEKPKNLLGLPKEMTDEEMRKLILDHVKADDQALKTLANERALQVKNYIVVTGGINPGRVFVLAPSLPEKQEKDETKNAIVKLNFTA